MQSKDYVDFVLGAAEMRNETPLTRRDIEQALEYIEKNKIEVPRYPNGTPVLKAVFDLAKTLQVSGTKQ